LSTTPAVAPSTLRAIKPSSGHRTNHTNIGIGTGGDAEGDTLLSIPLFLREQPRRRSLPLGVFLREQRPPRCSGTLIFRN
jgi:hypothetical protein